MGKHFPFTICQSIVSKVFKCNEKDVWCPFNFLHCHNFFFGVKINWITYPPYKVDLSLINILNQISCIVLCKWKLNTFLCPGAAAEPSVSHDLTLKTWWCISNYFKCLKRSVLDGYRSTPPPSPKCQNPRKMAEWMKNPLFVCPGQTLHRFQARTGWNGEGCIHIGWTQVMIIGILSLHFQKTSWWRSTNYNIDLINTMQCAEPFLFIFDVFTITAPCIVSLFSKFQRNSSRYLGFPFGRFKRCDG